MSTNKRQSTERRDIKMSKAQMQQAIIKKKKCDAKALAIVEQLLEPNVNSDWLLQNLGFISKSHMEDVIEERSIVKLCGYVLCSKSLTVIIRQQYHISTRTNKVYDVSRRKNFCSSSCYGAANYLLEQMLSSPLWLREKDDVPVFQILPINSKSKQYTPGDEIDVAGINLSQNVEANSFVDDNKKPAEHSTVEQIKADILNSKKEHMYNSYSLNDSIAGKMKEISINTNLQKLVSYETPSHTTQENKECDSIDSTDYENNYSDNNIQKVIVNSENLEIEIAGLSENILHWHEHNNKDTKSKNIYVNTICNNAGGETLQPQSDDIDNNKILLSQLNKTSNDQNNTNERLQSPSDIIINKNGNEKLQSQLHEINSHNNDEEAIQSQSDICNKDNIISAASSNECKKKRAANKINKNKKCMLKESNKFVMYVEQSVKEWITEDTLCFLMGDEDKRCQLVKRLKHHEEYQKLSKKLCELHLKDEKEDRTHFEKDELKPLPHFSLLQQEEKKIELKVRAFYEGRMAIASPEDSNKESKSKNDGDPILPLTDSHTPNALRRRIFLQNLRKVLPDIMRAITTNANVSVAQYAHSNEIFSLIEILISTFNLSATNIVFKIAEWRLVGIIIIKMLSLIDAQLQSLFRSKQTSSYISLIMSNKLDSSYLDRLITEVINNVDASKSNNKQC